MVFGWDRRRDREVGGDAGGEATSGKESSYPSDTEIPEVWEETPSRHTKEGKRTVKVGITKTF